MAMIDEQGIQEINEKIRIASKKLAKGPPKTIKALWSSGLVMNNFAW